MTAINAARLPATNPTYTPKLPLRELTEQALLQQLVPAAVLVNSLGDILYLHGRTGMYLELNPGEAGINNILKMARDGLRHELSLALHKAVWAKKTVHATGLRVKTNGHHSCVNLTVQPLLDAPKPDPAATLDAPFYLVILEASAEPDEAAKGTLVSFDAETDARINALQLELRTRDEYIQNTHEELEASNEELKSSNEEMQSVNEELQATNEELETSKEELQSVNEELTTVNNELQVKVADLSRVNNDMNNLLSGTGIATVFVDFQLRILRFTPTATAIINLILSDVGRPVAHVVSNLVGYQNMVADVQAVLNSLIPKEVDVQTSAGKWYAMRIQPYRTLDNVIEGAVITFVDITEVVQTREALQKANALLRLAVVVRDAHDAITVQDMEGRILAWNPAAVRMYGWSEAEALAMNAGERIPPARRAAALAKVHELSQAKILQPYRSQRLSKSGTIIEIWMTATALLNATGQMYAIATTERAVDNEENK